MTLTESILAGLGAGLVSTAAMWLTEYPAWKRWGLDGVSEWHLNQALMARLLKRPREDLVVQGLILHFIHGGLAGIIFAIVLTSLHPGIPTVVAGVAFGLLLWSIAMLIMKPVTGVGYRNQSTKPIVTSLLGHLLYGILLGLLVGSI